LETQFNTQNCHGRGVFFLTNERQTIDFCLEGNEAGCPSIKVSGYYTPGTFQQYAVAPANYVTPIPESLDSAEAAPLLCGGVTVYAGLKKANPNPGDWVLVAGAGGGLGHLATQFARNSFSCRVIAIDRPEKEDFCKEHGATEFLDFTKHDDETLLAKVKEITGGTGVHCVLVVTSSQKSYDQSVDYLRHGGSLICIGITEDEHNPIKGAVASKLIIKQAKIIGMIVMA